MLAQVQLCQLNLHAARAQLRQLNLHEGAGATVFWDKYRDRCGVHGIIAHGVIGHGVIAHGIITHGVIGHGMIGQIRQRSGRKKSYSCGPLP
jgi:hypothetical protein